MTSRFDLVFGLGSACSCTQALRAAGLQFASFPLDWVSGSDLSRRAALVADGFDGWLRADDFERVENPGAFGHDTYRNRVTDLTYPHDFDKGVSLAESFATVSAKYDRRVTRLKALLSTARRVLVVWIGDPRDNDPPGESAIRDGLSCLSRRWPEIEFRMLVLDCAAGVAFGDRCEVHASDYDRLSFDYACHMPDAKPWSVEPDLLRVALSGFACVDYRTPDERRAERQRDREREWRRFGATSAWRCLLNKIEYRLWRHLLRGLKRDGVNMQALRGVVK